jgi:hypothetical protein
VVVEVEVAVVVEVEVAAMVAVEVVEAGRALPGPYAPLERATTSTA